MGDPKISAVTEKSVGVGLCYHISHLEELVYPRPTNGIVITGTASKTIGPNLTSTMNGIVLSNCGHLGFLITGSDSVVVEELSQCRVTSQFTGDFIGELVTGADNHTTG